MGEDGRTLVVGCGHHELGVALDVPDVDTEARARIEIESPAGLPEQPASMGAFAVGIEHVEQMAQGDPEVLAHAALVAIGPQGGGHPGPRRLVHEGQVQAELAHTGALPGRVSDGAMVASHATDAEEGHGRRCRVGQTPPRRQVGAVAGLGRRTSGEEPSSGCPGGDGVLEPGHGVGTVRRLDGGERVEEGPSPEGGAHGPVGHDDRLEEGSGRLRIIDAEQGLGHGRQRGTL